MARNGSGTYNLPAGNPVVTGTTVSSSTHNTTMSDIATALTGSIAKDGQTAATADLPMGGNKHTGVGDTTARTDYAKASQVQDGTFTFLTSPSGADDVTATGPLSLAAYAAGQEFRFIAAGANTGAMTLNINSIGAKSITKHGTEAMEADEVASGAVVVVVYDGTQFQWVGDRAEQFNFPTLMTAATASSATEDFTGIPSWVTKIEATLVNLSSDSTNVIGLQLGDSGGFETSGYAGGGTGIGIGVNSYNFSSSFLFTNVPATAADALHGVVTLVLSEPSSNTWAATLVIGESTSAQVNIGGGSKSLSAVLTQIRFTANGGTFDGGTINVRYS